MDASSKHSSSAATASLCFSHIQELWARLAWPDPAQAQALGTQLSQVGTAAQEEARALLHFWGAAGQRHMASSPELRLLPQDLCEAAVFYSELLRKKVDAQPGAAGEAVSEPVSRRPVGGGWGWGQEARRGPPPPPLQLAHLPSSARSLTTWSSCARRLARRCEAWCGRRGRRGPTACSRGLCSAARRPWRRTCSARPAP